MRLDVPHLWLAAALAAGAAAARADEAPPEAERAPAPCSAPGAAQFDFWLGEWELRSRIRGEDGAWLEGRARNSIRKTLGGCVVEERFDGSALAGPAAGLRGMSVSVWLPGASAWKQTWVDNQGGYLDFTGGMKEGEMVLVHHGTRDGKPFRSRMVWKDIERDSLTWSYERAAGDGDGWTPVWVCSYTRVR